MQLEHLEVEEFREFLEGHPLRSFMQTPEIGRVREMNGWTVEYLGLKEINMCTWSGITSS